MKFYIVIPAYNEAATLPDTLMSLARQTLRPKKIVVVNDNSTDSTQQLIDKFTAEYKFIEGISTRAEQSHLPGAKVVRAFNAGLKQLDDEYEVLCKFDADLIFPKNYLEKIAEIFRNTPNCGIAGGFCYTKHNDDWRLEDLTGKTHVRGGLKAYRKQCFETIGGLRETMGWDTVDEMLALFNGWEIKTDESLKVKHLKPTGSSYSSGSKYKQGEAFYKLRYGWWLTVIASMKLAFKKNSWSFFWNSMRGFARARSKKLDYIVSDEEGKFIRKLRWKGIRKKIF